MSSPVHADDEASLYSVELSGVVTLSFTTPPSKEELRIAAVEALLDIIDAAGGAKGFADFYADLGTKVEYMEEVKL